MTPDKNQKTFNEAVRAITPIIGLMIAIFALLEIFLSTSLVQPIGALVIGLVFTVILVWMGKLDQATALSTWLATSIVLIIVHLIVSRPATVVGSVVDSSNFPSVGLTLLLTDSSGVDHKAVTDENGEFEIKNIPEGKFTILVNDELLISGRIPSGLKGIIDPEMEVGSLVHKPSSTTHTPTPACPPANAEGTVPPAVIIHSVTFVVNGIEQVVNHVNSLQASPGDQIQIKEVTICSTASFEDRGGKVHVEFNPVDQNGQSITSEIKGTKAVGITSGFSIIPGPDYTWTIGDGWRHISVVTIHHPPGGGTQNSNCEGGACEVDDRIIVGIQ